MTPLLFMLIAFAGSMAAGLVGSLLGLGGGIIVVPILTLLLGVDIQYAIGASIVSVIATSSGAGAAYVKAHVANIRVGMFLEPSTTLAAILGAFVTGLLAGPYALRPLRLPDGLHRTHDGPAKGRPPAPASTGPHRRPTRLHGSLPRPGHPPGCHLPRLPHSLRLPRQRLRRPRQRPLRRRRRHHEGPASCPSPWICR